MKDYDDRPRERERLAAQQGLTSTRARIESVERKIAKLDAEREELEEHLGELYDIERAHQETVDSVEAEYGGGSTEAGDGASSAPADPADAAWLAGDADTVPEGDDA